MDQEQEEIFEKYFRKVFSFSSRQGRKCREASKWGAHKVLPCCCTVLHSFTLWHRLHRGRFGFLYFRFTFLLHRGRFRLSAEQFTHFAAFVGRPLLKILPIRQIHIIHWICKRFKSKFTCAGHTLDSTNSYLPHLTSAYLSWWGMSWNFLLLAEHDDRYRWRTWDFLFRTEAQHKW